MTGRFLLFGGSKWYPSGGGHDLLSDHDTVEDATAALPEHPADLGTGNGGWGCQWAHVFDVEQQRVVLAWGATYGPHGPERDPRYPDLEPSRWERDEETG